MDIVRPEAVGSSEALKQAGEAVQVPSGGKSFEQVLSQIDGSQIRIHSPEGPPLQPDPALKVQRMVEEKTQVAQSPGGIQRLGAELERNATRLDEMVGQLRSGRTFSPEELLNLQAEMCEITLEIQVTTKVVSETVSGVRQLMQQPA